MILTVENTSKIGNPVDVFDANGELIYPLVEANTETGECVILRTNENGMVIISGNQIRKRRIICKPPLAVVSLATLATLDKG